LKDKDFLEQLLGKEIAEQVAAEARLRQEGDIFALFREPRKLVAAMGCAYCGTYYIWPRLSCSQCGAPMPIPEDDERFISDMYFLDSKAAQDRLDATVGEKCVLGSKRHRIRLFLCQLGFESARIDEAMGAMEEMWGANALDE